VTAAKTAALTRLLNLDQASSHQALRRSGPAHGLIQNLEMSRRKAHFHQWKPWVQFPYTFGAVRLARKRSPKAALRDLEDLGVSRRWTVVSCPGLSIYLSERRMHMNYNMLVVISAEIGRRGSRPGDKLAGGLTAGSRVLSASTISAPVAQGRGNPDASGFSVSATGSTSLRQGFGLASEPRVAQ